MSITIERLKIEIASMEASKQRLIAAVEAMLGSNQTRRFIAALNNGR